MNQPSILTRSRAKEIASLDRASKRKALRQFLVEGWRGVEAAIAAGASVREVLVRPDADDHEMIRHLRDQGAEVYVVRSKTLSRLSDAVQDQGVIAVADMVPPRSDWREQANRIVLLDGIQDPGNVGTIVRCAAWFGFDAVLAAPQTADFYNPKTVRSMAGAIWDVVLDRPTDPAAELQTLRGSGFGIVGAEMSGQPMSEWAPARRLVLVLGSEAHGISEGVRRLLDSTVGIEHRVSGGAGVESLNVSVAAGILMYHILSGR